MSQAPSQSTVVPTGQQQAQAQAHRQTAKQLLLDPDTYATTLLILLVDTYGLEVAQWTPQAIALQVTDDFGVELPKTAVDRIMAGITLVTTNYFYKSLSRFIDICNVLSGSDFDPGVFDPADSYEMAWAITEALLLSPPEEPEPFTDDIRHYITAMLADEGYVTPPDILRLAIGGDLAEQVRFNFADDPEMFQGIYANQQSKTAEVKDVIKDGLAAMLNQIAQLPLKTGSAENLLAKLRQELKGMEMAG